MNRKSRTPDFEQALGELEQLVERLEHGDLPLDEALRTYERGVSLTRQCQTALKAAQAKVEVLASRGGAAMLEPFTDADDDDTPAGPGDESGAPSAD